MCDVCRVQVDALRLVASGQIVNKKVKKKNMEKGGAEWNRCVGAMG